MRAVGRPDATRAIRTTQAPDTWRLDSRNPRQHSQRQVNQLADSIQEFGFVTPVVADDRAHDSEESSPMQLRPG